MVIDGFGDDVAELRERGRTAQYQDGGAYYPGIRAGVQPDFLDRHRDTLIAVMTDVFGFRNNVGIETIAFSLVTRPEAALSPMQCIPHFDHAGGGLVAGMLYLLDEDSGGTAFYRHRRTGFETISAARLAAYQQGVQGDDREYGPPPQEYYRGSGDRYEQIGEVTARPGRLALYPGSLLHSGIIPEPGELTDDPEMGRLTVNMFFKGN